MDLKGIKMKQLLLLASMLLLAMSSAFTQRTCGTMDHLDMQQQADPKIIQRRMEIEAFTQNFAQQQAASRSQVIYNIPVVFHVVYNTAAENISTTRINEQLAVLNNDFRKLNSDASLVPAVWQGIAADCEINFCLATIDPNGNPTTGITRTQTSVTSFGQNDAVKYTAQGGINVWDRNFYLNIWVCDLTGTLLGYATFPGGAAAVDGVVLDYQYTGVTGASSPFNKGRTATHEVGHWLNLIHIWGDDNGACSGSDQVTDTPNQANATGGCPSGVQTDACATAAPGYMWMNYMDYTDDACMYMFTAGQRTRVQAAMAGPRAALATSNRCSGAPVVTANFFGTPTTGCAPLTVAFTNQTFGNPTTYLWNFGNGATSTAANPSYTYTVPGTYTVTLIASNASSGDTIVQTNYVTVSGVTVGAALPFTETFETGVFTTNNWQIENPDAATTWGIATTAGTTPGTRSAFMDFFNYTVIGQRDGMITKSLNLSGLASATMTFDHAYKRYYTTNRSDSLVIFVSTNSCTNNWTRVFAIGENGTQTFATTTGTGGAVFTPTAANQWCAAAGNAPCYTVNLTPFIGNNDVRVRFQGYCDYGNNLYIDNINITGVAGQAAPIANFTANNTTICAGQSVTFTDASTNTPTAWAWNFGNGATSTQQNPTYTYTTAGTYTVTLTASNALGNDQEIKTGYILVRPRPSGTSTPTATTCGNNNGGVAVAATGGTSPYTYLWSNGITTSAISNVATGTYTVTITDANGCQGTSSGTVTAIAAQTVNVGNIIATTCGLNNGGASVAASGGTSPYTYLWSNGATTSTISNLAAGTYTVSVTDASGCVRTGTANIATSSGPSASITATTPAACGQNNGTATVTASGGAGGYTYLWGNGQTGTTATGLAAGSHTVTVTSGGCTRTAVATVGNVGGPTVNVGNIFATTCGQSNGAAGVTSSGGTAPYTYLWSNGTTTNAINNVASGSYNVTVTDAAGCQAISSVSIGASSNPTATATNTAATCGQSNGSATAAVSGGTAPYGYLWSNGQTTATTTGLGTGSFTVTVTDAAGCTTTASTTVAGTNAPSATTTTTTASCNTNSGSATVVATGGIAPYSYLWSNGQTSDVASGVAAGTYTVTVTDAAGCTTTASAIVQGSSLPVPSLLQQQNVNCAGGTNGAASLTTTGGASPYTYLWPNGATTAAVNNLSAGTYVVTVTDANNCSANITVVITAPSALSATGSTTPENGSGANDGTATATVAGGTAPYSYVWSNGQTTATATGLAGGGYQCTITDANGCVTQVSVQVSTLVGFTDPTRPMFGIAPNPTAGRFTISYTLPEMAVANIRIHDALGQQIWQAQTGFALEGQYEVDLLNIAEGIYFVELIANGQRATAKLVIRN
jgi:PKD repeat protein